MTLPGIGDPTAQAIARDRPSARAELREASVAVEAHFLSTLMKSAGLDARRGGMGGGIGEEQFASFLRDAQAQRMAAGGGLGLAQAIFEALTRDG